VKECLLQFLIVFNFECSTCKQTLIAITYKVKSAAMYFLDNPAV